MASRRWRDLDERTRKAIVVAGAIEGVLKVAALVDLKRRPPAQIRGSKRAWRLAVIFVNSAGAVPLSYFALGRRT